LDEEWGKIAREIGEDVELKDTITKAENKAMFKTKNIEIK
jgi:hypothetical protein